jgi:hypothetical protein
VQLAQLVLTRHWAALVLDETVTGATAAAAAVVLLERRRDRAHPAVRPVSVSSKTPPPASP